MNDTEHTIAILNQLHDAEASSLMARSVETHPFVSWVSADDHMLITRMLEEQTEHQQALADMIVSLDGVPEPTLPNVLSADLHFVELRHLLPHLLEEKDRLIRLFETALARFADASEPHQLIGRILDAHRRDLTSLQQLKDRFDAITTSNETDNADAVSSGTGS